MAKRKTKRVSGGTTSKTSTSNNMCHCQGKWWLKLSYLALAFFLMTVWPGFNNLVMSIHWGWFLGATVLLSWIGHRTYCMN